MKRTISVNVAGSAFVIDEDAYERLSAYLDDVASRSKDDEPDMLLDVEQRLAEIFTELGADHIRVVTMAMVVRATGQVGSPDIFGTRPQVKIEPKSRLARNGSDKLISGVCSGLAAYLDLDATLVRILLVIISFFGGVALIAYVVLWIVLPVYYYDDRGNITTIKR